MTDDAKKKVLTYLLLAFAPSAVFYYLILAPSHGKLGNLLVLGLMWCPGVAALATRLIYQGDLGGIGWGWGRTRYQVAKLLLAPRRRPPGLRHRLGDRSRRLQGVVVAPPAGGGVSVLAAAPRPSKERLKGDVGGRH